MVRVVDTSGRVIAPRDTGLSFGGSTSYDPFSGPYPIQRPRPEAVVSGGGVGGYFTNLIGSFDPFSIAPSAPIGGVGSGSGATVGGVATNAGAAPVDGQGGFLGNLLGVLGSIGSTGDAPVEATPVNYAPGGAWGGLSPTIMIAGGAALIGLLIFMKK